MKTLIIIILTLFTLNLTLNAQTKLLNDFAVDLLKDNRDQLVELDTMIKYYCDYTKGELTLKLDNIRTDMEVISNLMDIVILTASGRNASILNFHKLQWNAKYEEFIKYCYNTQLLIDEVFCGDPENKFIRFKGRLYFLYFDIDFLIKAQSNIYLK